MVGTVDCSCLDCIHNVDGECNNEDGITITPLGCADYIDIEDVDP